MLPNHLPTRFDCLIFLHSTIWTHRLIETDNEKDSFMKLFRNICRIGKKTFVFNPFFKRNWTATQSPLKVFFLNIWIIHQFVFIILFDLLFSNIIEAVTLLSYESQVRAENGTPVPKRSFHSWTGANHYVKQQATLCHHYSLDSWLLAFFSFHQHNLFWFLLKVILRKISELILITFYSVPNLASL